MLLLIVIQTTKDIITHGREQIEYELMVLIYVLQLRVPLGGTYIMKPTASCEAAQLWVRASPPSKYSSPKGDLHIPSDIEDDSRSRFAEPGDGEE